MVSLAASLGPPATQVVVDQGVTFRVGQGSSVETTLLVHAPWVSGLWDEAPQQSKAFSISVNTMDSTRRGAERDHNTDMGSAPLQSPASSSHSLKRSTCQTESRVIKSTEQRIRATTGSTPT